MLCNQTQILRLIPCVIDLKAHYKNSQFQDSSSLYPWSRVPSWGRKGAPLSACLIPSLPGGSQASAHVLAGDPVVLPELRAAALLLNHTSFVSGALSMFILDL